MSISFNRLPFCGSVNQINSINKPPQSGKPVSYDLPPDRWEFSSPARYTSEYMVNKLANSNPNIQRILAANNIPYSLNMEGLNNVLNTHAKTTQNIAEGIAQNLPFNLGKKADLQTIKNAAYLHDIGKVFIPPEILDKNGKLTETEQIIMHKHPELGYELLKNAHIDPKVLHIIRNHHQNAQKSGYPKVNNNFYADMDLQIVSIADKYSALTEKRSYKPSFPREQALNIIRSDVRDGKFNPLIYNALVSYTDDCALSPQLHRRVQ